MRTRALYLAGAGVLGTSVYMQLDRSQQIKVLSSIQSVKRAGHAVWVWGRLVVDYKSLYKNKPPAGEGNAEEVLKFKELRKQVHERNAARVLSLCEGNGGIFIKMGQYAASLRSAIPDEYIEELRKLQDQAPTRPLEDVCLVLEQELDENAYHEIVEGLDPEPLGSASLAQVHRCTLRNGKSKAIKVQHLGLDSIVRSDLQIARVLDWLATKLFNEEGYSLGWAVREFEKNLAQEMDFNREAANAIKMNSLLQKHHHLSQQVVIPDVDFARTTQRVLTMDCITGLKIQEVTDEATKNYLARTVLDLFSAMFFTFGFVHCDPHFGNFLVAEPTPDHPKPRIALLDHGLYRQLDESFVENNALLWRSMITGDRKSIQRSMENMGIPQYADLFPLLLTNRPACSAARLGAPIPRSELLESRKLVGADSKRISLGKFLLMADDLPVDMLFVLRTMHLVKDLHRSLGGENRARFYTYGKAASASPDAVPAKTVSGIWRIFKYNIAFQLHESLLEVKSHMRSLWTSSSTEKQEKLGSIKFSIAQLVGDSLNRT